MKQIIGNKYLQAFRFSTTKELATFVSNQNVNRNLSIESNLEEFYYCYVCYHSLTKEKQFFVSFSSNESEENLNFLFWSDLLVFDTGENIYLLDETLKVKASLEITAPLVGMYLIDDEKLLILEEIYLRVINQSGEIIKSEVFDLIEDFNIDNNILSIQTSEGSKSIDLALY